MTAHTPGPWSYFVSEESGESYDILPTSECFKHDDTAPYCIGEVFMLTADTPGQAEANAALIAAAPELLARLIDAVALLELAVADELLLPDSYDGDVAVTIENGRAAIAKAEQGHHHDGAHAVGSRR